MSRVLVSVVSVLVVAASGWAQCGAPSGYYASIDTSSAASLRRTLHARIENHRRVSWNGTWAVLESADQDPGNGGRIRDVYRNASYAKVGRGNSNYDREHSWPKSLGFAQSSGSNYPESDCHGLFLSAISYNGARGNKMFRTLNAAAREWPTAGGSSGQHPGTSNWASGTGVSGGWETWVGRRGDVARALFYFDVRYDGSRHSGGAAEPDLVLTDDVARIVASQSQSNLRTAYMGLLSVLLEWHRQDPPDAKECRRNGVVFQAQGNRNPFIDHPEWVARLYGGATGDVRDARRAWINELHYDNSGTDRDEMVEIAGPRGLDLTGWRLVAYNGNGGRSYATVPLRGVIGASGCIGTIAFDFPNLQNGPQDAIALVDDADRVVQFLGYEGTMVAVDGVARGMRSVDIGVSESFATPVGHSLQLRGSGSSRAAFTWSSPAVSTRSRVNNAQTFVGGCGTVELYGCGLNPVESMCVLDGAPALGSTLTIALHNPLATQAPGAGSLLAVSVAPPAGFPCGLPLVGFSMRSAGARGELLVHPTMLTAGGPSWGGVPAAVPLAIPNDTRFLGARFYLQGALLTPRAPNGIAIGLTEALRIRLDR